MVPCNAFVFIELLNTHFFTNNDWVETTFHVIVLLNGIDDTMIGPRLR